MAEPAQGEEHTAQPAQDDERVASLAQSLRPAAEALRGELIDLLAELTGLDAPSGDAESLAPVAALLEDALSPLADRIARHETAAGPVLEVEIDARPGAHPGERPDSGEVLILCHYDTVWPRGTVAQRPFELREGVVHGPGVLDMRAGIAAAIGALRLLRELEADHQPVRMLLTPDEESGSAASRELIESRASDAGIVLVPEPSLPGGALKTARKGWLVYRLLVTGRAAHAGLEPERGVSAIDELVDQLTQLRDLAEGPAGITLNCGELLAGNPVNVVADRAEVTIDVRVPGAAQEAKVRSRFAALAPRRAGAEVRVQELHSRPPLERTPQIAAAAERAQRLAGLLGIELGEGAAGGVSDANLAAAKGVPVLDGLGAEGSGAHSVEEHAIVDSLLHRSALIALLIAEL